MTAPNSTRDLRPSYRAAGLTALVVLALYVVTLAPTTAMWDASEYITAAYTLGIPHPPGNPLFVLLARAVRGLCVADGALVRRSRRTARRPHPRAHRLSDWTGIHQSSRRLPRGARGGDRGDRPSTQDHAALATHRERAARTRARAHAVRIRADSCGPPSGAERRGTDRVQRPHRRRLHLLRQARAAAAGQRQSRSVRKA